MAAAPVFEQSRFGFYRDRLGDGADFEPNIDHCHGGGWDTHIARKDFLKLAASTVTL
jgi:hypothetical protein